MKQHRIGIWNVFFLCLYCSGIDFPCGIQKQRIGFFSRGDGGIGSGVRFDM